MSTQSPPEPVHSPLRFGRRNRLRLRRRTVVTSLVVLAICLALLVLQRKELAKPLPLAYHYIPSPNCDERPPGIEPDCVVLHATVEPTTPGTVKIFLSPASDVSAHFVVGKDGQIIQMVPVEKRAWHAGTSEWGGREKVNDFSVGIEMVNLNTGNDPYTEAQIQAVAGIIRFVRSRYPIPDDRIVSHAEVAQPPGRKSDPRNFDFDRIRALAKAAASSD